MEKASREKLPPPPPKQAAQRQPAATSHQDAEDEQVEKFYALLANIRVERHLFKSRQNNCKKRLRMEEPPWKPTFTMQDFEESNGDHTGDASKLSDKTRGSGETTSRSQGRGEEVVAKEVDLQLTLSLG